MSSDAIVRAVLAGSDGSSLTCQFNPSTLRVSKSSNWSAHPARGSAQAPRPQFVGTGPQLLSAQLLFDGFDSLGGPGRPATVHAAVSTILNWTCVPARAYEMGTPQPPTVTFQWGTGITFTGFLRQVQAEYTMFSPDGTPLRATADITLQEVPNDPQGTNPTSGGVPGRRSALLADCESLAAVAYREYGDPAMWRAIAQTNEIEDPARVPAGTRLLVPPRWPQYAPGHNGQEAGGGS